VVIRAGVDRQNRTRVPMLTAALEQSAIGLADEVAENGAEPQ
jgi:hypothetical protein